MAKQGTLTHRRTRRIADGLGIELPFALGVMEAVFDVAARLAPAGDIGRMSNRDIADEMWYRGDVEKLVSVLVDAGLLDQVDGPSRLIVHGWSEHAPSYVRKRLMRLKVQAFADGAPIWPGKPTQDDAEDQVETADDHGTPADDHGREVFHPTKARQGNPNPTNKRKRIAADAPASSPKRPRKLPVESAASVAEACEDWTEIIGGVAPGGRIAGAWPALLKFAPWAEVRPVWRWYLEAGKANGRAEFCKPQDFAERFDYWRSRQSGAIAGPVRGSPARAPVRSVTADNVAAVEEIERRRAIGS